jgi:hypothetical protein
MVTRNGAKGDVSPHVSERQEICPPVPLDVQARHPAMDRRMVLGVGVGDEQ